MQAKGIELPKADEMQRQVLDTGGISSLPLSKKRKISNRKEYQEGKHMPVVEELIRTGESGTISFGNYKLDKKSKVENFEYHGDLYKVKTFYEITKLERNGMFVYESVPGTAVEDFEVTDDGVKFKVEGNQDAQITVQLEDDTEYEVYVDGAAVGGMKTNMSGKLVASVELEEGVSAEVKIVKR